MGSINMITLKNLHHTSCQCILVFRYFTVRKDKKKIGALRSAKRQLSRIYSVYCGLVTLCVCMNPPSLSNLPERGLTVSLSTVAT